MSFSFLYLASQSPRRRQLLDQLGVSHRLLLPLPDEDAEALEAVLPNEPPEAYVRRVTLAKFEAAQARLQKLQTLQHSSALPPSEGSDWPDAPILCADTTVALDHLILGKPQDAADASRMLHLLSGRSHRVLTAVVVNGECLLSTSEVQWRALSDADIQRYIATGEPMGKAGAYAIQSQAAAWTANINGSYSGIMGLPLFETAQLLGPLGWNALSCM